MDEKSAKEAAAEAVDEDRLLDGEDPRTTIREDADHWARVYEDLMTFKHKMLATAQESIPELEPAAKMEITETDLKVLTTESEKFRKRLEFWQRRQRELSR